ncbi:hypothetical protein SETIT_4G040900v2 [Setaria italica]|uniref:Uncharacterized protein n=1 Tax=Setaria italica TaxID=4555 RepID=A0A368QQZ6_SETIT|nr:hypothetical protein SETIT_4G040900v2 [Setaria italica]RCV20244.1 hypothetical protein SETIT_4G040900v2 [Setaria italica]
MRDARRSPAAGEHRCAHAPAYAYSTPRPPRSQPRRCAPSNPCAAAVPSSTCSAARHTADVRASAARPVLATARVVLGRPRRPRPLLVRARPAAPFPRPMPRPRAPVTAPARTGRASARPYPPKLPPQAFLPPSVLSCNSKQAALVLQIATTGSLDLPALPRIKQTGHQLLQSVSPSSLISTSHTSSTSSTNPWRPSHLGPSAPPLLEQSKQTSALSEAPSPSLISSTRQQQLLPSSMLHKLVAGALRCFVQRTSRQQQHTHTPAPHGR